MQVLGCTWRFQRGLPSLCVAKLLLSDQCVHDTHHEQAVMSAGGVIALMHACGGSSAELQIATLTVLRQLVVQPTGPDAFLVARAVPLLAMLQHSLVAEIRILATKILDRISASSSVAEEAIADEQVVQVCRAVTCPKALNLLRLQSSLYVCEVPCSCYDEL